MERNVRVRLVGLLALLLALFIAAASAETFDFEPSIYAQFKKLHVTPASDAEVQLLNELPSLDIHRGYPLQIGQEAHVMLSGPDTATYLSQFPANVHNIKVDDVGEQLAQHRNELNEIAEREAKKRDTLNEESFFANYRSYAEMTEYADYLVAQYGNLVEKKLVGYTTQHREMFVLIITDRSVTTPKRQVLFDASQHAREWLATSSVWYALTQLLTRANEPKELSLLKKIEFHFVPLVNIDGYEYSRTNSRMWRKNRRQITTGIYGVDTNRNWGVAWGYQPAPPRFETYQGEKAFSEKETQALSQYVLANNFRAHVDFHTYGREILRRWANNNGYCADEATMKAAGDRARDAITAAGGNRYVSDRGNLIGLDGGVMPDWTYTAKGMISYTIELSQGDFALPASLIVPTGIEAHAAIIALAQFVQEGRADASQMRWPETNQQNQVVKTSESPSASPLPSQDTALRSSFSTGDLLALFVAIVLVLAIAMGVLLAVQRWRRRRVEHLGAALGNNEIELGDVHTDMDAFLGEDDVVDDDITTTTH